MKRAMEEGNRNHEDREHDKCALRLKPTAAAPLQARHPVKQKQMTNIGEILLGRESDDASSRAFFNTRAF